MATYEIAIRQLAELAGDQDPDVLVAEKRLAETRKNVHSMDTMLTELAQPGKPIPNNAAESMKQYQELIGSETAAHQAWKSKHDEVLRLQEKLAQLKQQAPVDQLQTALNRLSQLVGENDPTVQYGLEKIQTVESLRKELRQLDRQQTPSPAAQAKIEHLKKLIGENDEDLQRWSDRLSKIISLKLALKSLDENTDMSFADANAAITELSTYVGNQDHDVLRWQRRRMISQTGMGSFV